MNKLLLIVLLLIPFSLIAQKKPLDHNVYDSWQSVRFLQMSNNGKFASYMVCPQEGDSLTVIKKADGETLLAIERGYAGKFTYDSRFFICKIKPFYTAIRQAKIDRKKLDDMPKDSLAIVNLATGSVEKLANLKNFKTAEEGTSLVAYLLEIKNNKNPQSTKDSTISTTQLQKKIDSLNNLVQTAQTKGLTEIPLPKKDSSKPKEDSTKNNELIFKNLAANTSLRYYNTSDYALSKKGNYAAVFFKKEKDTFPTGSVAIIDFRKNKTDTVLSGLNDVKSLTFDDNETQLSFIAEKDSSKKSLRKFYNLYHYNIGRDSATAIVTRRTAGMKSNWQISENNDISFSKNGQKIFVETKFILPLKDTSKPEFERVHVDVWNYKDPTLQTMQLSSLGNDLKKDFVGVWNTRTNTFYQLADSTFATVKKTGEGNGKYIYLISTNKYQSDFQWTGVILKDIYLFNTDNGKKERVAEAFDGNIYESYTGKYALLYDNEKRNYSIYNAEKNTLKALSGFPFAMYDEENDMPQNPQNYGIADWTKNDEYVLINDRYDIWKADAETGTVSLLFPSGRKEKITSKYIKTDREEKYIDLSKPFYIQQFNEITKQNRYAEVSLLHNKATLKPLTDFDNYQNRNLVKAKNVRTFLYTKENYTQSPDAYLLTNNKEIKLSSINPQQSKYLWGSAELFKWTAYTGKLTEGIVYKPENFDANKKYPMIVYFYERSNETLYDYIAPAPTPSRLNISFFVSRGYVVFVPDIWYTTGYPGQSAYDYIVSGTRALVNEGFIDSTKLGLQGQSWGGYQTTHLITRTNLYNAAWAGAPVSNMFSAYGGIRWQTGMNRQFQYEKTQSRIGATIWEKPELYKENSPLFYVPDINTPLVIMHNDNDGAVPWYQGIEMFTAMRRLNKPVWLLNYNNDEHNLMQRRNRKDISVRQQQFFDWLLKDAEPAPWIKDGVPAIMKGRTWGL